VIYSQPSASVSADLVTRAAVAVAPVLLGSFALAGHLPLVNASCPTRKLIRGVDNPSPYDVLTRA